MTHRRTAMTGTFLVAFAVLTLQIALTRVLAIMMWHHFTYMVVSLALLGFGAAGSRLTARADTVSDDDASHRLAWNALGFALSSLAGVAFITLVRLDSLQLWSEPRNILALLLVWVILAVPFYLAGVTLGLVLARAGDDVNRLYFADLAGSALGGALSVPLLDAFGGMGTVAVTSVVAGAGALSFSLGARRLTTVIQVPAVALLVLLAAGLVRGEIDWPVPFAPGKEFGRNAETVEVAIPGAMSEVEVGPSRERPPMIGGSFGRVDSRMVRGRLVGQDGTAPTMLYENAADIGSFPFLDDTQAASGYVVRAAGGAGAAPRVLVIGTGGGIDVMVALAHGAEHVTAVEINPAMIDAVTRRFDDYLGGLFRPGGHALADRIGLVCEDGRSFVRRDTSSYDVIQLSGVDSFTALNTGAYALAESYLYTVEAVHDLWDRLSDDGVINYSRFILTRPKKPRETLRLANIARHALALRGIDDPAAHIAVFQGFEWASTLIQRRPFTVAEIEALREFGSRQGFRGLVFDPVADGVGGRDIDVGAAAVLIGGYVEKGVIPRPPGTTVADFSLAVARACAATYRGDDTGANAAIREIVGKWPEVERGTAESLLRTVVDRAVVLGRADADAHHRTRQDFHVVLRGSSDARDAFAADYEYDITPCTDDRPFFFNYYRYGALVERLRGRADDDAAEATSELEQRYHPDFPVGHLVLAASLVQITLLAGVLILAPLGAVRRRGAAPGGRLRVMAYFAALGCGFMFVEMALMQKLAVYLGHPTWSISVVLTSLLAAAGCGSWWIGRRGDLPRRAHVVLALVTAAIVVAWPFVIDMALGVLPVGGRVVRASVTVVLLLPLGFVLGMPFPTGLRLTRARWPDLIPWAWAVNGFLSVLGSLLAVMLAMFVGFSQVLLGAGVLYLVGMLPLAGALRAPAARAGDG